MRLFGKQEAPTHRAGYDIGRAVNLLARRSAEPEKYFRPLLVSVKHSLVIQR